MSLVYLSPRVLAVMLRMTDGGGSGEVKVEYVAMLLGGTGNVGRRILHLLVQSPLCKKVVVVTRRNVAELANPKVQQVVVNMDKLEEELAPHAKGVDMRSRRSASVRAARRWRTSRCARSRSPTPRGFGPDVSQSYHNRFFHLLVLFHAAMSAPVKRECRSTTFASQITEQQP
jgi:hypothetical protein